MRKQRFNDPTQQAHFEDILKYPEQYALSVEAKYFDGENWITIDKRFIIQNSTKFSQQASDTTDITIGGVYLGQAEFTMALSVPEPIDGFIDKRINLLFNYYDPTCDYDHQPSGFPLTIFNQFYFCQDSTDSDKGRTLKLTDYMMLFDKKLPLSYSPSGDLYTILATICEKCDVGFAMTRQQVHDLPNGNEVWGYYPENGCETYRDVLHYISQACCGFCYYDQVNHGLVIKSYNATITYDVLEATNRINGANLASYATQITSASFTNADGSIDVIGSSYGKNYDCGFNPFLSYGQRVTLDRMREAVFNVLYSMQYKPFNAKVIIPPIYDLGDKLLFTGGVLNSQGYYSCIQKIDWDASGLTLQGFGKNPKSIGDKSGNSKTVAQATRASELVTKRWGNYDAIHVGSTEVIATQIDFSALRSGVDVEMWHEFLCNCTVTSSPMIVTAYYYLDGVLLDRRPIETISESGEHILDLHYSDTIQESGLHRWVVKLSCQGGSIDFDQYDVLSVLKGQGLEKEASWTGLIVCSDFVNAYELPIVLQGLNDHARATLQDFAHRVLADNIVSFENEVQLQTINDNCNVTWRYGDHILRCGLDNHCGGGRMFGLPAI